MPTIAHIPPDGRLPIKDTYGRMTFTLQTQEGPKVAAAGYGFSHPALQFVLPEGQVITLANLTDALAERIMLQDPAWFRIHSTWQDYPLDHPYWSELSSVYTI